MERTALYAADRWLEHLDGPPDRALAAGPPTAAGGRRPGPVRPAARTSWPTGTSSAASSRPRAQWLTAVLTPLGGPPERRRGGRGADLVAVAWSVPWERERTRRLIGLAPDLATRGDTYRLLIGRPGAAALVRSRSASDAGDPETQLRVARRAAVIKGACRAYYGRHGTLPPALANLVTDGLIARVPDDPFAEGHPFGYRKSTGEELVGPARAPMAGRPQEESFKEVVNPGEGVLWSVGVDRVDQGGRVPPGGPRAEDIVYLVKLPAAPR